MTMYLCKLVHNGFIVDSFYREAESISDMKKDLDSFQWPAGTWKIQELNGDQDDD